MFYVVIFNTVLLRAVMSNVVFLNRRYIYDMIKVVQVYVVINI